jgi:citrate synthase
MKLYKQSSKGFCLLKERIREIIPAKLAEYKDVKEKYGSKKIGDITVGSVMGGMRGMTGLFYETSKLDAQKGILYRDHNLFELTEKLKFFGASEPCPEALIWFLFTGEIPNEVQVKFIEQNMKDQVFPKMSKICMYIL